MNKITAFACMCLFALGLAAFAQPLTMADNGKTLNLAVNDPVEVKLEGNPTTGYVWEVEPYDTSVIKAVGEPDYQSDSNLIGAGGVFTFKFQAVAEGQTTLKFIYHRTFEKDVPPIQTYELKIVVGTANPDKM
jgi:inhibitor of cysteine peptidase